MPPRLTALSSPTPLEALLLVHCRTCAPLLSSKQTPDSVLRLLPVRHGCHAKDPLNISRALRFAPEELGATVFPSRMLQIDRNRWLLAMRVRVIADVVTFERGDHIGPPARLEDAGFFANHLERRTDAEIGQQVRCRVGHDDPDRVVVRRGDVGDSAQLVGIAPDQLDAIFEEFAQAGAASAREYGGTGLGLTIARRLARLMGGEIVAESVLDSGSIFTLTLPLRYDPSGARLA